MRWANDHDNQTGPKGLIDAMEFNISLIVNYLIVSWVHEMLSHLEIIINVLFSASIHDLEMPTGERLPPIGANSRAASKMSLEILDEETKC